MADWYYNPSTGEVSEGKVGSWANRMGPYATREQAENALKIVQARNKAADAEDEKDDDWGDPAAR
ncbi:hypothetical protein C3B44_03345 [Corynebacterium yudongzhengii]|uniref:SPOR domain-containing protein n=1 Tax=Corynebacterium yudongzhengii TaxID=2080740 RepID=A0A2U1T7F6_9CORY|nr:hypothetical protein [Corynebacterium yudongzhengii]AWB81507.1 hypothetical protein C3B44_03345 [Corynebacterium yudongzhengii]PWC01922.1 hypothetical protein DF222_04900 [Corynebacterium yudongzhengii]